MRTDPRARNWGATLRPLVPLIILAPAGLLAWWGYAYLSQLLPLPPAVERLAADGVESNGEWQPTTRSVGGRRMALVPAGCFVMGASQTQLEEARDRCDRFHGMFGCPFDFSDEQPAHQVCFDKAYWIDVYEVTNWAYGSLYPAGMVPTDPLYVQYLWPRGTVNWEEADTYCRRHGARLPTEAEWEYAARGPDNLIYPWGNSFDPSEVDWYSGHPYQVGSKENWVSWVGAHDLAAGMAEWVSDWYGAYSPGGQADPGGPGEGELRVARGGHWFSRAAFHWRTSARATYDPGYASSTVGFRCARDFR